MNHGNRGSLERLPAKPSSAFNMDTILDILTILTCPICLTDYQTSEVIFSCSKKHHFCRTCFTQYLEHLISESQVIKIVCPQDGCMETIEVKYIEQLVSASLFEKYKTRLQSFQDNTNPTQIRCPKPNCLVSNMIDAKKEFTVCQCGVQICNNCRNIWHKDKNCLQAINEELGEFSKTNETRLCMNCKSIVTKMAGCSHMTCSVCKYNWCWVCGRKYLPGHFVNCPKKWRPQRNAFHKFRDTFCSIISIIFVILILLLVVAVSLAPVIVGVTLAITSRD